jgi:uncharacterized protein (TIGR00369 family)
MTTPIAFPVDSPFIEHLGIRLVSAAHGEAEVVLSLDAHHLNAWDVAHGGVTMTLLDIGLGMAARSLATDGVGLVTVEMKTSFMQPGRGELRVLARVLHKSSTMAYCEGDVRDSHGNFVAKGLGTFKYLRRLAVGRSVAQQKLHPVQSTPDPAEASSGHAAAAPDTSTE